MTGLPPWWAFFRTRRTARGALRRIDDMNRTLTAQAAVIDGLTQQNLQQGQDIKRLTGRMEPFHDLPTV